MNQIARDMAIAVDREMILGASAHRVVEAAMDDMSAHILEDYLKAGFREVEWRYGFESWQNTELWRQMGSVCPICFALDGQRFKIEWLLSNMHHNAPKYSMSHVNCACKMFPMNRTEEMLDYSETVDVAPAEIPDIYKDQPIDLGDVAPEQRTEIGLPADENLWTDIKWKWDDTRNEFVPLKTFEGEGGGESRPWVYDEQYGEMIPHEEWVSRYT